MKKLNFGILAVFSTLILSGCGDDHSSDQLERGIYEICGLAPHPHGWSDETFLIVKLIIFSAAMLGLCAGIFGADKKSVKIFTVVMALIFAVGMGDLSVAGIFVDSNSPHEICSRNVIDNWDYNKTIHENVEKIQAISTKK